VLLFNHGPFEYDPGPGWNTGMIILDFILLGVIFFFAVQFKSRLVQALVILQAVPLAVFELFVVDHAAAHTPIFADSLSLLMVLVISIIGSIICIFGLPYMDEHERHLHLETSKQPRFFFYMLLFLGAMNGLVLSNNLMWLYFFFEVTTFCSFMLIGHDGTEEALSNSLRALWINSLGGVALLYGIFFVYGSSQTLELKALLDAAAAVGPAGGALLFGIALACVAGFVKAAQCPMQSWLLGAMVAPTPVSALLHSSTMVKAGVYMVLRLAPIYEGTFFSDTVALVGAFTFFATAALAMGQRNGKKILAYSTIGNLGLIVACAGLNTPPALAAAILLILFHAVSKALLFLCVGTIQQGIGSLDIEDMRGLYTTMPRTALITVIGVSTMLLPPFGVLLSKWLAIESAANFLVVVVFMALASAISVVYWGRWAGILMSSPLIEKAKPEPLSSLTLTPLQLLAGGAVILALFTPWLYAHIAAPMLTDPLLNVSYGVLSTAAGAFVIYPLFFLLLAGVLFAWWMAKRSRIQTAAAPYMCGVHAGGNADQTFRGPMDTTYTVSAGNYYLEAVFGETGLTPWVNLAAGALLLLLLGGAL
jgi:ech hydrogenase subunit A